MDRKKWIALSFALLLCVSSIVIFCNSPCHDHHSPQEPIAIRRDVRPIQTKEVATPSVSRASQSRTAISPEDVSAAVAAVCGHEAATANRYEARNAALCSLSRCRDLNADNVQALMDYLRTTGGALRVEREAALKNDVLNLLRNQSTLPDGLVDLLMEMFACNEQPSVVRDYALQHLGALQKDDFDAQRRWSCRDLFVAAAKDIREPFAGTALYSLAATEQMSKAQETKLRRLTVAACGTESNPLARMSALQLAGERGYREVLPIVRKQLDGARRDAVTDTWDLAWNGQYQLVAVATNGVFAESYSYDALGRRVSTTNAEGTERHVYDESWQVIADVDESGSVVRAYEWGEGTDQLLAVRIGSRTYTALTDIQGTVWGYADAGGSVVARWTYDAWGNVLLEEIAEGAEGLRAVRYRFQGRERSAATGLANFRMRWYDPATGRWLSKDPIGLGGGLNLYAFCGGDAINLVDPIGWAHIVTRPLDARRNKVQQALNDLLSHLNLPGNIDPRHAAFGAETRDNRSRAVA